MRIEWMLVLLLLPAAAAHGAAPPREFEQRLLTDTTSSGDYGGPESALGEGLDLLALDAFEGTVPGTAEPALVLRVTAQGGGAGEHTINVAATAGGSAHTLSWTSSDLDTFASDQFVAVRGPFPVGDGHAFALEGVVPLAALGMQAGDEVTGIRATTVHGGDAQDVMPGTWYAAGTEVPLAPTEEAGAPASYRTAGPTPMFATVADRQIVPPGAGVDVGFTFTNLLSMEQTLRLTAQAPAGITVRFQDDLVALPADGDASASLNISGVAAGTVQVLVESELGSALLVALPLQAEGLVGTGGEVDSGDLQPGQAYQYTFTAPGRFEYHCHPHPWMSGAIDITQAPNGTAPQTHVVRLVEPAADSGSWGFDPAELAIHTGDTVIWLNDGSTVHTIMGSTGIGGHHDHDHDHGPEAKKSPLGWLLVPLALAVALRRR